MKILLPILAVAGLVLFSVNANAAHGDNQFDQFVTPDVIYGSGNTNGGFTTDQNKGVEVGLRIHTRFPTPLNDTASLSNGDGTYSNPAGSACPGFGGSSIPFCLTTPLWSFDWSVNTDSVNPIPNQTLNQLVYQLGMDSDPGPGTDFTVFDPITPSLVAPAWDNAIGDNSTANGGGDDDPANYVTDIGLKNVAQNSWSYEFFNNLGTSLESFDPSVDGNYVIFLRAIDPVKGKVVAETVIQVLVGDARKVQRRKIHLPKVRDGRRRHDDDDHEHHDRKHD